MYFNRLFLEYFLNDNHCVSHSLIKPVDAVTFKRIKELREVNNDKSDSFEMAILDEGALYKALEGPKKLNTEKTRNIIYEVIGDKSSKQLDVDFPKDFILKCKK